MRCSEQGDVFPACPAAVVDSNADVNVQHHHQHHQHDSHGDQVDPQKVLTPVIKTWLDSDSDKTLTEFYPGVEIIVQVVAIGNPNDCDNFLRISDGQVWVDISVKNEYKKTIEQGLLKTGQFIKIRTTTGSIKTNDFKLVWVLFL